MQSLKIGQVLKGKGRSDNRVVSVGEDGAFIGIPHLTEFEFDWYTNQEIQDNFEVPEPVWEPKVGEKYWYVNKDGQISSYDNWVNDDLDRGIKDFMGVFPTKEAGEKRLEEIKSLLK